MKVVSNIMMMAMTVAMLFRCTSPSEPEAEITAWHGNLYDEKYDLIRELNELEDVIEEQLNDIVTHTSVMDETMEDRMAHAAYRLHQEKHEIERTLLHVQVSSENTWDAVRDDMKAKVTDVKIEVSRVRERVRNEFDINQEYNEK